jgi:hypothetical protein
MERSQLAAIIIGISFTIFFIILFHRNRKTNHHTDLKNEILESRIEEVDFEKSNEQA